MSRSFATAILCALALLPACKKHTAALKRRDAAPADAAPTPRQYRIVLTDVTPKVVATNHPAAVHADALAAALRAQLIASPQFFARAADVPHQFEPCRARVDLTVDWAVVRRHHKPASAVAAVKTHLVFTPSGGELDLGENVIADKTVPTRAKNLDTLLAAHVARAVEAAGRGLIAKEKLRDGPDEAVVRALGGEDPTHVAWALAIVGDRKLARARPAVEKLLRSTGNPDVRAAAVGALVAIGDPRSVAVLTKMAKFSDIPTMRLVIEAVSAIGGAEARSYLQFVASGHPDPDIRRRAREGLERLRRRARAHRAAAGGNH